MAAGREQHLLEQLTGGLLALALSGRGGPGIAELGGQRVARALELPQGEQARPGGSSRGGRGGQRRVDGGERAAELGLQPRDLLAQRPARSGLVDVRCDERVWRRGKRPGHAANVPRPAGAAKPYPLAVPRNDPTDTGGLFIGRRPGTGPVRYRAAVQRGGAGRRRVDSALAALVLAVETLLCLTLWGPQPVAWLWVGSQVDYRTGMVTLGIASAFAGMIASLLVTLVIASRLDHTWRLLRRAAGHDQKAGMLGRIFMVTAVVAAFAFGVWFLLIEGPGPTFSPQ